MPTTLVLSLAAVAAALVAIFGSDDSFTPLTVGAALAGLVPWALVAGGVRVPVPVFAIMTLACAAVTIVLDVNEGGMFPVMLMVVWVARSSGDWRVHAAVLAVSAGLLVATAIREKSAHEAGLVYFAGGTGISWLAGLMLRRQESLTIELQAMNELRVEHAATAERARIAREVHDVVAHSLTVVMLHLTGARRAMSTEPERAEEALARAESVGRESLESIRQVMGVLREHHGGRDVAAQPGLGDVDALIDGYRIGGLAVDAAIDDSDDVDPTVGLVIYRVVQESLTNVLRHASGASCSVAVSAPAGCPIRAEIVNGPVPASAGADRLHDSGRGLGVRGMTERVRAVGGELVAGPSSHGGWQVTAIIPRRRLAPTASGADGSDASPFGVAAGQPEVAWTQPTAR